MNRFSVTGGTYLFNGEKMNKITIDNITEQQLEDMIEIIRKISKRDYDPYLIFDINKITFRAQETFKLIRNQ